MDNITVKGFRYNRIMNFKLLFYFLFVFLFSSFNSTINPSNFNEYFIIDSDGDGVPDDIDIDDDNDGIIDSIEGEQDDDNDGYVNRLDIDSDNDGLLDNYEAQYLESFLELQGIDLDKNGLDDIYESSPGMGGGLIPIDTDGDDIADYVDIDSDNDGILDQSEASSLLMDYDCSEVPNLNFSNSPILEKGEIYQEGSIYRISEVYEGIDVLITVEKIVNGTISNLDQENVDSEFFKPEIQFEFTESIRRPYVDMRITLVEKGTSLPYFFNELTANFIDVDGNPEYQEFNRFDTPVSYSIDNPTEVTINNTSGGFLINGGTKEYTGISNLNPSVNVAVQFVDISTFVFRFGVQTSTNQNFETVVRQSGIQFSCLDNFSNIQTTTFSMDIDSDNDGFPDRLDIDSDNDGLPDNVEAQVTKEYLEPSGIDENGNGLDDSYENENFIGLNPVNTDGTDNVDYLDDDSDNDLVPDNNEGNDFNYDGVPDQMYTGTDTDGDGLDDGYEGSNVNDGFDVNDEIDDPANDLPDTDGTEDVNYRDLDDDGDGIDTPDEDANNDGDPTNDDTDNDGTPDYLDPNSNNTNINVVDDVASTDVNTPVDIDILDNDSGIPTDGTLTTSDPDNGTVQINDNGTPDDITDDTITYTPIEDFEGTDTFDYTVCDAMGTCDTGTITVTVGTPVALDVVDDVASTDVNTPVNIDILDNDSGIPTDGTLTTTDPDNGTVEIND
ncbi:MAG: Ig-like domain-containing protein, partial [Maribacter sp.]